VSEDATTPQEAAPTHGAWTPSGETPPPVPRVTEEAVINKKKIQRIYKLI